MRSDKLCPFCDAGITKPITPSKDYIHNEYHPAAPQSRICALAHYSCGDGKIECLAWDPSPTGEWNTEKPKILISHHLSTGSGIYVERPRLSITHEQLAQAGLQLVFERVSESEIWFYTFEPLIEGSDTPTQIGNIREHRAD